MSPPKRIQPKNYLIATEQISEKQAGNKPVLFLSCSINCLTDIQEAEEHTTTTHTGDTTIQLLTITTLLIEEGLVRDEQTNEFYLPLISTVVQQRIQEMLYVPLEFENNLTVDALLDSRAYVSAIAQNDMDTIEQKTSSNSLKVDDPPNF